MSNAAFPSFHDSRSSQEEIASPIVDAAIAWMIQLEFNQPTPAARNAFNDWLQEHPAHAEAWQRVHSLRDDFSALPKELARNALHAVDKQRCKNRISRRQTLKLLMLAGVTVTTTWVAHERTPWQRAIADASTKIGEQRTIQLADGSVVMLNTDSAVSFAMTEGARRIILHRGEIMITTGPDSDYRIKRPFWVDTPFGAMEALGTRFVVRLDEQHARVSVEEGAVHMHPAKGGDSAIAVVGESWWLSDHAVVPGETYGITQDSWADGVIAGQNIRLSDLLAELARYRRGRIVCDAEVGKRRVSGIYHIKNTDQVLQFLLQTEPISVTYYSRFWVAVGPDVSRQ